ncbi:MAG: hypothetical protein WCQ91_01385 [Planctomycetota bacterium]
MPPFSCLDLTSLAPRRIFVPFECAMGEDADKLWKATREDWAKRKSREVAVFFKTPTPEAKQCDAFTVRAAKLQSNGRAKFKLWENGLSFWRANADGTLERLDETENQVLDLAVGLAGPKDFGLFVTWNPGGSDVRHVFFSPGDFARLSDASNPEDISASEVAATYRTATQGEPFILLDIPAVAILPLSFADTLYGDALPDRLPGGLSDLPQRLWRGLPQLEWQFYPHRCHIKASAIAHESPGFGLAIDFGTSASTIAIFPSRRPAMTNATRVADPIADLAPWPHFTDVIRRESLTGDSGVAVADQLRFDPASRIGECSAYPFFMDSRQSLPPNRTQVPSILHAPDFQAESRLDREVVVPESAGPQCFIGDEVRKLVELALPYEPSDKAARAEWDRYLYAPKSLVGRMAARAAILDHIDKPIEAFLRELFDQAYFTCIAGAHDSLLASGPLQSVTYSYPVTWTDYQRDCFHAQLKAALGQSLLSECLPEGRIDAVVSKATSMDEASAAFIGFVMKRFSGLEGRELLHAYQPFNPGGGKAPSDLKPVNVLVFDCGEGTTDIVWLEITQAMDPDTGSRLHHVDSTVKRHFATEQAGLEVTRRIAQYVKDVLIQNSPENASRVRKWICTKLGEKSSLKKFDPEIGGTLGAHRMGLVHLFYKLAEELKIDRELTATTKELAGRRLRGVAKSLPELSLPDDKLKHVVRTVFGDAVDQVRSWFKNGPRLDVVIMSGRSCQLPELAVMLREAIPAQHRPFAMDFVTPETFLLEPTAEGGEGDEQVGKTCVVTGLVLNRFNIESATGQALRCHPIDALKRTRAIGVQHQGITADRKTVFSAKFPLLAEPDNGLINPEEDLGPLVIEKGTASSLLLAINFAGKKIADGDQVDPVHPFIDIDLDGGGDESFDALHLYFRQKTSTDMRLSKIELHKAGAPSQTKTVAETEAWRPVSVGRVKVRCKQCPTDSDFRNTGQIHINNDDAVDL